MPEKIILTTPFRPDPRRVTEFQLARLEMNWLAERFTIELIDPGTGLSHQFHYDGEEGRNMMRALNRANLSSKSLHRRVMEKLLADGHLEGNVTGAPD